LVVVERIGYAMKEVVEKVRAKRKGRVEYVEGGEIEVWSSTKIREDESLWKQFTQQNCITKQE